jgi:hypothetical protein
VYGGDGDAGGVHRDRSPDGHQGRRLDASSYGWLSDTSMVVMTVIVGSLMSQAVMPSGFTARSSTSYSKWFSARFAKGRRLDGLETEE